MQLVSKVRGLSHSLSVELADAFIPVGGLPILVLLLLSLLSLSVSLLVAELPDLNFKFFLLSHSVLLHSSVVEEPLGEEVDWVGRLRLIHDGHSLGDNEAKIVLLQVSCIGVLANG